MKTMLLLTIALAQAPVWADSQPCRMENATLKGTYVITFTGTAGGPAFGNPPAGRLFAAVGKIVYDGLGNLDFTFTSSIGGFIIQNGHFGGTYSVNPDCTGTMVFNGSTFETPAFDIISTPHGRQVTMIQTNTGTIITGTAVRMDVNHDHDSHHD